MTYSSTLTVEKIGGTSIADTNTVLDNVLIADRRDSDLYNRVFVVSAYAGITDLLLEHKKSGAPGVFAHFANSESDWSWGDALDEVVQAMLEKNAELFGGSSDRIVADNFVRDRIEGVRSCLIDLHRICSYGHFKLPEHLLTVREMLSGLGEAHSAFNTSLLLTQRGVNATFVDLTGWRDETNPGLDERILTAFENVDPTRELPIVTGYAHCAEGLMKSHDRGYTEVTFSRLAVLLDAGEAIIHKEFHLSSADPKIVGVDKVQTIGETNYDVADQLANLGMEAIHPHAAKGLRQAEIPLRVKNTFDPKDAGTRISGTYVSHTPRTEIIAGIPSLTALEFFEQDMVGVKGYDAGILEVLKRHNVNVVCKSSNANTIIHYLTGPLKAVKRVVEDLKPRFPSADINTQRVALVSAIGSDLSIPGLTQKAVGALVSADIPLLGVHQLMRNVDIQFIVTEDRFETAIRALHAGLVENAELANLADVA